MAGPDMGTANDPYLEPPRRALPEPCLPPPTRKPQQLNTGEGACAGVDPKTFSVDDSAADPQRAAVAKAICAQCPLRARCLAYAMDSEAYGIWGGLDARERLLLREKPLVSVEERADAQRIRDAFERGMTAGEVAAVWGVTRRTVERWRSAAGLVQARPATGPSDEGPGSQAPAPAAEQLHALAA